MPDRALRITLLIHALHGGGAEQQIRSLANYLVSNGMSCTLITLDSQANDRFAVDTRVIRVGLDAMKVSRSIFAAITANRRRIESLRSAVRESQPDCAISFCDKTNILALAACRPLSIPMVISERSDPRKQKLGWKWEAARRWYYPHCSACVTQTAGVANHLRNIISPNRTIAVIPSAIAPPLIEPAKSARDPNQPCRLLYIGRLSHEKGPDRLLQAWSTLAAKFPSWKLNIVGEGPLASTLKQFCHDQSLEQRVEFLGWQDDVWTQLYHAHAFALPSRYEGFPGVLLEAMYAKLPVVATECSDSIRELIVHEQTGMIAKNNVASLTQELDRILIDADLGEQLGMAARRKATEYLWPQIGSRWMEVIREVLKRETR